MRWKPDAAQPDPAQPRDSNQVRRPWVLTAGESQGAGVRVHGEVVQLQLALCVDGEP